MTTPKQQAQDKIIEELADLEHQQFSHIIDYIDDLNELEFNNKMAIWLEQLQTKYKNLSEKDKEKDRIWARKVMSIIQKALSQQKAEIIEITKKAKIIKDEFCKCGCSKKVHQPHQLDKNGGKNEN
jgi:ABC-type transport system involved in cytochrome bd biosynthesis fused ATPase/permease subunit